MTPSPVGTSPLKGEAAIIESTAKLYNLAEKINQSFLPLEGEMPKAEG